MPDIMVRCPTLGAGVSTGLTTELSNSNPFRTSRSHSSAPLVERCTNGGQQWLG